MAGFGNFMFVYILLKRYSRNFFEKLCGGSLSIFANALCDSGLTKEELAELRVLLEQEEL